MSASGKKKVAILGGGVGAMTAAFELSQPGVRDDYDITVYQLGWRLGGKGASGRNAAMHQRIEEHGPHVWSGVYENAFQVMRAVYGELGRPAGAPLATWRDAFKPMEGAMTMLEEFDGDWVDWTSTPAGNDQLPGDPDAHLLLPVWSYVREALGMLRQWFRNSHRTKHEHHQSVSGFFRRALSTVVYVLGVVVIEAVGLVIDLILHALRFVHWVLETLRLTVVIRLMHWVAHAVGGVLLGVAHLLARLQWMRVRSALQSKDVRMKWVFLNFALGVMRGLHKDALLKRGFSSIDDLDFREWLGRHIVPDPCPGAPDRDEGWLGAPSLTLSSPLALFLNHADFGYENGDLGKPRYSAGVAVHTLARLAVTWKGALIWHLQAGMGDVVFGPIYEVLKERGVRFEFFHKVKALHLSEDGGRIDSISVARQASLVPGRDTYDPLVPVKGLPCWPSSPVWSQLEGGHELEQRGVDFEDWYGPEVETRELRLGADFDEVVLGISLGGVPYVCEELVAASPAWKAMVEEIGTVRTQALQYWLDLSTWDSGWEQDGNPTVSCYDTTEFNEWADFSLLIDWEDWPEADKPKSIIYLTGPMKEEDPRGRKQTREELDKRANTDKVRSLSRRYLEHEVFRIATRIATPDSFEWRHLYASAPPEGDPERRLDRQYMRANVQPSERYVLSLPGTSGYRLLPTDSGFDNLVLAGDWTWSPFNSGCVEAATISGRLAAHGVCGSPALDKLPGLRFGEPNAPYGPKR